MALYIGKIKKEWVHTYSKKLRDKYLGTDYVVVFIIGTGRAGGTKVRNSISITNYIKKYEKGEFIDYKPVLENGKRI